MDSWWFAMIRVDPGFGSVDLWGSRRWGTHGEGDKAEGEEMQPTKKTKKRRERRCYYDNLWCFCFFYFLIIHTCTKGCFRFSALVTLHLLHVTTVYMIGSSTFGAPQKLQSAAVVGKMAAYQKMAAMFHAYVLTMQCCMSSIYPCSIVQKTAKASRIRRWEEERKRCKTKRKTSCWIPSLVMHLQGFLWNLNDAGPLKTVSINSRNLEQNYLVNLLMLFSNVRNDVIWSLIWRRGERYTWLRRRKQQPRSAPRHAALVLLRRAKSFNIVNRMGTEEVETRKKMCLICPGIDTWTFLEGKKPKAADESADAGLTMQYWGLFVVCCLSFAPGFGT